MSRIYGGLGLLVLVGCTKVAPPPSPSPDGAITRVIGGLRPPVAVANAPAATYSLADRLAHYKVPGVSIAVVDSGRLVWAKGFGVKEAGTTDSVTPTTMFQAASISKPVAATAVLRLVEEGKLNLDQDVNLYLTSWKVPDNRYVKVHKPTLRRIVSHSAGFTVHGFPGYASGAPLPTVAQILDGKKPANTPPVRIDTMPGMLWRYSGGGITVMQQAVMDVTKEPFAVTMQRLVLGPVGMKHSTYQQPLPDSLAGQVAAAHEVDGSVTPGRWHSYPEQAAAGLWTTPTDLVTWAMSISDAFEDAGKSGVLSSDMAKAMLSVAKAPSGLGPMLAGKGKGFNFSHGGSNQGFRCEFIYFPALHQGAAVMTNGEAGSGLAQEILYAIAAEYKWPEYGPKTITPIVLDSAALTGYSGSYTIVKPDSATVIVTNDGKHLYAEIPARLAKSEVVFSVPNQGILVESGEEINFQFGKTGNIDQVILAGFTFKRKGK